MVHYLLDTNIVSELARPEPNARMRERYRAHEHETGRKARTNRTPRFSPEICPLLHGPLL